MTRHWLLTAFEPLSGRSENNSKLVLNEIEKLAKEASPFTLHYLTLPFEYDRCFDVLDAEVARLKKSGVFLEGILSIGEGAEEFKIETQANNLDDLAEMSDNAGEKRVAQKIFKDLDKGATLPLRFPVEIFARIRSSKNPGFFVGNHLCAQAARKYGEDKKAPLFGFIHVPKTGQGGMFTPDVCAAVIFNSLKKIP